MNPTPPIQTPGDIADRVLRLRRQLGMTQVQFAKALGVSFASVNRWENGQARPNTLAWQQMARLSEGTGLAKSSGPSELPPSDFLAEPGRVTLVAEAERLSFAHLFNPAFATEISLIDPLPHQRLCVYDHMLLQPRLRFLLADDAGAGKTIMAGLYIREMLARRVIRRVLVVPPAGLVGNWERELRTLFSLPFKIVRGADAKNSNPFAGRDGDRVICSVDTLSGPSVFARLKEPGVAPYDLVIFDEAHKLSADRESDLTIRKTDRYALAEALAGVITTDPDWSLPWAAHHLLLLTATPHMGKEFPYYALWRLLEPEILPTIDAFNSYPADARAKHFIRRTKEEMVHLDGRPLYPQRKTDTLGFDMTQGAVSEQTLYDRTTDYMQTFYNRAGVLNKSAARLTMSVFQRRLASSTYALLQSFDRRAERLDAIIRQVREGKLSAQQIQAAQRQLEEELFDPFERTTADEEPEGAAGTEGHEADEAKLLKLIIHTSLPELEAERQQVAELRTLAQAVLDAGHESKFERLREIITDPRYRNEKLILFTEHRDTLEWIRRRLEAMGFTDKIASVHGGMDYRARDLEVDRFRRPHAEDGAQYFLATDAAGEGINLQFCWLMVNYDVPWNPARLEQRMGRIHRYGQKRDSVVIINLIAHKTREGRVISTLLRKLESIRKELRSDKVFDVVGRLFENVSITDFMNQALDDSGAAAAASRIEGMLTKEQVEALEAREKRLFGDGGDVKRELARLRDSADMENFRKLIPGFMRQFVARAAEALGLAIDGDPDGVFSFRSIRPGSLDPLWPVLETYPPSVRNRLTVYRPKDKGEVIFLHPGEAVFERLRSLVLDRFAEDARKGAVFIDPTVTEPFLFFVGKTQIVHRVPGAKVGEVIDESIETQLVGLCKRAEGDFETCPVEQLLLLRGADRFPAPFARLAGRAPEIEVLAEEFLRKGVAQPVIEERRHEMMRTMADREAFVEKGFDFQSAELAAARAKLTEKSRAGNAAATKQLGRIKDQQRAIEERQAAALTAIRSEPDQLAIGSVRLIARAMVVPALSPEDRARYDADVEAVAMQVARAYEESMGATVKDVSTPAKARAAGLNDNPGFDLLSQYPDGRRRAIEVKGRATIGSVEVTENEWARACILRDGFWMYVVFDCGATYPRLCRVRDPFARLLARAKGSVVIDGTDILAAADTGLEQVRTPQAEPLPDFLRTMFWDVDASTLRWPTHRDTVIGKVLAVGGDEAFAWLSTKVNTHDLRLWLMDRSGGGLDGRRLRYWQNELDLPAAIVDRWIERSKTEAWGTRQP